MIYFISDLSGVGPIARLKELEALLERARERVYSGPVSVDPNDALWNDIGRALVAAEKP